ncbi:diacylglycerol/lipid kinase family protein [Allosalinactinospora lopnorensis]|uniref:diacylglycerol/lipid kinase family protein n=1 Tax=Allosalinactinospora lopnorensis TaxID=1352348 RepID=UPI000623F9C1|nr:YegS/Rv2252/BmrU family lipid kinase [Allosalinactinospora lopnorensis]
MTQNIAILVNPTAGSGRSAVTATRLIRSLRERGAEATVIAGRSAEDSVRLAREAVRAAPDALVAVGGDGLVHTALQGVVGTGVPLGVVPTGTGNDIAREFGLPRSVPAAVETILDGRAVAVDTVRAGGRHYLSVLACGFDSRVNERVNGFRLSLGRASYLVGLLAELRTFTPIRYVLEVDGEPLVAEGMCVAVGNTASYGGGMRICPDAVYDDRLLDVVFVHAMSRPAFLRFFPRVFRGTHPELDEITVLRGRTVTIATEGAGGPPTVGYADGERLTETPITCEAIPGSVRVLTASAPPRTS